MSFWKTLGKIASFAAPIVAAPFTGGASLALIGAGAGALGGAIDNGWKGALTGAALGGATAGLGDKIAAGSKLAQMGVGATKGLAGAIPGMTQYDPVTGAPMMEASDPSSASGSRIAGLLNLGKGALDIYGQNAAEQGASAANQADQYAMNRRVDTMANQAGPGVDAAALRNMARAGLIASRKAPTKPNKYITANMAPDPGTQAFAAQMRDQLLSRMQGGQPLTLSGMQAPTPEELTAQAATRGAASKQSKINIGKGIAGLAPTLIDLLRNRG